MKKIISLSLLLFISNINAQVGIGTVSPDISSILDVTSTDKGILIPRINLLSTTDVTTIATPATSLLIYNTASIADVNPGYYYWNGTQWLQLTTANISNDKWSIIGNSGTDETINFIGTTDDQDLVFKRNNVLAGRLNNSNTSFGVNSFGANTTGVNNNAIGANSLRDNITGNSNTASGANSLLLNTIGNNNTATGTNSLRDNTIGVNNSAIGANSLLLNTTGFNNTGIGLNSLRDNTIGNNNTAVGVNSLVFNTTGVNNVAIGINSLRNNSSAVNNIALGTNSLTNNTTGSTNTGTGTNSLRDNITGNSNTASGANSLLFNTTADFNTATGANSLRENTTGENNTAVGVNSLRLNVTGANNTAVGSGALNNLTSGDNNIGIGLNANVSNLTGSNQIRMGNAAINLAEIQVAWSITSDMRWKNTITNSNLGLNFINELRPVSYYRNNDETKKLEYGFIAQELQQVLKNNGIEINGIISENDEGKLSVRYNDLFSPIVKAIQEQTDQIERQAAKIDYLEKELQEIKALLKK